MDPGGAGIDLSVNGKSIRFTPSSPYITLLDGLRSLGLTAAKEGCAEGECGTCMVALVSNGPAGTEYRAVNSCLMWLPMAANHEIYTAEGLAADGTLAEAQRSIAEAGGSQCGYCTPGFVVSLFAEQYRPGREGPCDPLALSGNLCRCTGYRPIVDAARAVGPAPDDRFRQRLAAPAPRLEPLDLAGFSRPTSIDACLALLAATPDATLVAGGTDVGVDSNLKQRRWPKAIAVDAIDELREFSITSSSVRIGAALPLTDIGLRWRDAPAAVREWLELFASPPIRNRATLGGNLATASPIGDGAPLLLALDATLHLAGTDGRRMVPIADFFTGYRRTMLRAGEMITAIEIPLPLPARLAFYKVSKRRLDDISTVAAAFAWHEQHGTIRGARLAFGGVAATPQRLLEAERAMDGETWSMETVRRVQDVVGQRLSPLTDHRGSREYRLAVAAALVEKCWAESAA